MEKVVELKNSVRAMNESKAICFDIIEKYYTKYKDNIVYNVLTETHTMIGGLKCVCSTIEA